MSEMAPQNPIILNNLAWAANEVKHPKALMYAQQALMLAPDNPAIIDTVGTIQVARGEVEEGLANLRRAVSIGPDLLPLQLNLAKALVKAGRKDEARAIAQTLLEKVGMEQKAEAFPYTLSGGQKQRVAIARALAMSPEVILFDEPTSALDPERVGEVLTVMKNLSSEGYTMIVVTHEMEFARAVSDQVVFLEKGLLIEKSAPEKFFTNPETERVRKFLELSA